MVKLAIFASGSGSNAQKIIEYFKDNKEVKVELIVSNKKDAFVLERAKKIGIPAVVFEKNDFKEGHKVVEKMLESGIDWIILAGFLLLIPTELISAFPDRIINIHPALLPAYGGKGMYGMKVHEAVLAAGEKKTGITIHMVNERYDEGKIIFQECCEVEPGDTPDQVAEKVHKLEHAHFPKVIEQLVKGS